MICCAIIEISRSNSLLDTGCPSNNIDGVRHYCMDERGESDKTQEVMLTSEHGHRGTYRLVGGATVGVRDLL